MLECMVIGHERDGSAWRGEWKALSKEELHAALDPATYIGHAPQIVDKVLAQTRADGWLN